LQLAAGMTDSRSRRSLTTAVAVTVATVTGCATISSGPYGVPVDASRHPVPSAPAGPLRVSASELADVSNPYFGLVEFTFENDSPAWVQVDSVDLDFGSPNRNASVQIPWGNDLVVWSDAVEGRNAVRRVNEETALGVVSLLGTLGWAASGHHDHMGGAVAAVGGAVSVASLTALYGTQRVEAADQASAGPRFAGTHLLAMPLRVPPGLFTKRWILFYTADRPLGGCIDHVILHYVTADHREARVLLNYKVKWSEWQAPSCTPRSSPYAPH
jgi:hypothetical protein